MALFHEAIEMPPEEWSAWLDTRTVENSRLKSDVLSLLEAHEVSGGLLDRPVVLGSDVIVETLKEELGERYDLVGEIGRGGMAYVFLARERKHDRRVALKVMRPEVAETYGRDRFDQEVRLAAQLSHPHILGLIDSGDVEGLLYYAMPFIEGDTLRERIDRNGPLSGALARSLLRAVAGALDYAHGLGVIHRDLKPDNVLCSGNHAYLMDFGIAKSLATPDLPTADAHLTRTGLALGTPRYMAPEQAMGGFPVDHRVDLYAWGLLAYETLTGQRCSTPGLGIEVKELREMALTNSDVPSEMAELVGACLRPNPDERIQSAGAIIDVLDRGAVLGDTGPGYFRWSPWALGVGGVLAVAAAIALWPGGAPIPSQALPTPVAVAPFTNETGDPGLTPMGRLAGDWIAQGLQQLGTVPVLPWSASLESAERAQAENLNVRTDLSTYLGEDLGAGTVITGSIYRIGDELQLGAVVTDVRRGRIISAPQPIQTTPENLQEAIREVRNRIMASLAISSDDRFSTLPELASIPPTFPSYRDFDRGIEFFLGQDYPRSSVLFNSAWLKDTTFLVARVYEARSLYNETRWDDADAVLDFLRVRRARLSDFSSLEVDFIEAMRAGDGARALRIAKEAAIRGPNSRASWNEAMVANQLNRPAEALEASMRIDPDRGGMRGWAQYWTQLAHSHHLLGQYVAEEQATVEMQKRHPERRVATVLQARALGAAGRDADLEAALQAFRIMPPRTYWSFGAVLVAAGQELAAHGFPEQGRQRLEEAVIWLRTELDGDPSYRGYRFWLAHAYYGLERWDDAEGVLRELVEDFPERAGYNGFWALAIARVTGSRAEAEAVLDSDPGYNQGDQLAYQARLELILGEPDRAIDKLSEALRRGVDDLSWLHSRGHLDFAEWGDDRRLVRLLRPIDP